MRQMTVMMVIILLLVLAGCASKADITPQYNNDSRTKIILSSDASGEDSIIKNDALSSYKNSYVTAKKHKAFAQSDNGAWAWKADRTSVKHAINNANDQCKRNNKGKEDSSPCKIINIDGRWVGEK